jgi:hypothetical protein
VNPAYDIGVVTASLDRQTVLEALWRKRLETARNRYRTDADAAKKIVKSSARDTADDFEDVVATQIASLREYMRVLNIFTDLVFYGKQPPEE